MNKQQIFKCPKRWEDVRMGADVGMNDADGWYEKQNGDLCCNYCGSWHPEQFLVFCKRVVDTADVAMYIEFVDRGRKFYTHRPEVQGAVQGAIKMYGVHMDMYLDELEQVEQQSIVAFINTTLGICATRNKAKRIVGA